MPRMLSSATLTGVADLLLSHGYDPHKLAASVDLDPEVLSSQALQISEIQFNDLMEAAALACNDQNFLLHLAGYQSWNILGPVQSLLAGCETLGDALVTLVEFTDKHHEGLFLHLEKFAGGYCLGFEVRAYDTWNPAQQSGQLHQVDLPMAIFCNELRLHLGTNWCPDYVQFTYAAPDTSAELERLYRCNLYFSQDSNAICISQGDFDKPFQFAPHTDSTKSKTVNSNPLNIIPTALRVDRAIRFLLGRGNCCIQSVAEMLGVKPRTLQYQLSCQGTSYRNIFNRVRLDMAQHYLSDSDLTIGAISEILRFHDSSAFSKFFVSQRGCTAQRYLQETRHRR